MQEVRESFESSRKIEINFYVPITSKNYLQLSKFILKMKCKTFTIHLRDETRNVEEVELNKFLENLNVSQVFSSLVNNDYWSVLVFYDENFSGKSQVSEKKLKSVEEVFTPKTSAEKPDKLEIVPAEPLILTSDEERIYGALREWRNEQAALDGLPPYMIAHNDSLMLMARINPKSRDELVQIKGFGEKRAQKYGDELLQVINAEKNKLT